VPGLPGVGYPHYRQCDRETLVSVQAGIPPCEGHSRFTEFLVQGGLGEYLRYSSGCWTVRRTNEDKCESRTPCGFPSSGKPLLTAFGRSDRISDELLIIDQEPRQQNL
jgi:hypothetical protein